MERLTRIIIISVVFAALCAFSQPAFADGLRAVLDDDTVSRSGPIASTYIIQACRQANAEDADYLILEFDTSRGRMNLADVAAQAIVDCSATTVAFIRGECKGAPLYLALHCDLIYASFGASLSPYRFDEHGNAVPVEQEVADQLLKKMKNAVNKASRTTKNVNLELFFDKDAELYEMNFAPEAEELLKREPLRYHRIGGKAGLVVFALRELKEQLNIAFKGQLLESPRKSEFSPPLSVIEDSSRLRWLGVLDGFAMNLKALESELNVTGKALGTVTTVDVSVIQKLGVFVSNALVLTLLVTLGFLALFLELKTPGTFVGAGLAILFFAAFFAGNYLTGTAGAIEIVLFILGAVLLVIEILVIPGFGFIGGIGLILVIYSLFAAFIPGIFPIDGPSPFDSHYSGLGRAGQAFLALLVSFVLMGVGGFIISKFLPGMPLLKNLVHSGSASDSSYQSVSEKTQELVGKTGMALTELRPTGRVEIDDDIYDAQSEGGFLDKGSKVKVVRVSFSLIVEEA